MSRVTRTLPLIEVPRHLQHLIMGGITTAEIEYNWAIERGVKRKDTGFFKRALELAEQFNLPIEPVQRLELEVDTELFDKYIDLINSGSTDCEVILLAKNLAEKHSFKSEVLDQVLAKYK